MIVYFYDNLGELAVEIDEHNIQFWNGECHFSADGVEYCVPCSRLIEIVAI